MEQIHFIFVLSTLLQFEGFLCQKLISDQFPDSEIIEKTEEKNDIWKNQSHYVSISAVQTGIPARAVQFGDLLPVEEDLDNYNNIFSIPRGLNNNNNILPRSDQKQFQYFTEHEYGGAKAGGIKNILIENSAPKSFEFKNANYPSYCDNEEVCQRVNSKLHPPVNQHRYKRSIIACDHEVTLFAFGINYTMCIYKRHLKEEAIVTQTFPFLNVTVFGKDNSSNDISISTLNIFFASGHIVGEEYGSVSGYVLDNHFYGTVFLKDSVHYLEPHERKSRDMHIFGDGLKTLLHKRPLLSHEILSNNQNERKKTYGNRKMCELTIVADHLFFKEIGENSLEKTVLQMLWHVKEANAVFQSKDFDDDGTSECIGFTVSEISVFTTEESDVNLLTGNFSVPEDFLKKFSRYNFDGFCLGVLFTNRAFTELVLGLSWRGNPKQDGVGGICQNRVMIKSDRNAYSFNALFISLKSSQEERIPLRMGVLNLVHELMHSFGAKHDPEQTSKPECTPADKWINGRYLMSKYSNDGHKLNHMILSPCTKALVRSNLEAPNRVSCLKTVEQPFCGDMIVQNGEECDCGTILQCLATRSCCVPPEGIGMLKPCTLHSNLHNCARDLVIEEI